MTKDEALKLALGALEWSDNALLEGTPIQVNQQRAIIAIKEALAQPQQEPFGFMSSAYVYELQQKRIPHGYVYLEPQTGAHVAVYTSPPKPQQEPVAISLNTGTKQGVKWLKNVEHGESLYTSPPQRKPLTDEQVNLFINGRGDEDDDDYVEPTGDGFGLTDTDLVRLVRRVEAAHGIKE